MSEQLDFGTQREVYTFAPEALGSALPEFEIVREIGKGSMGIVYECKRKSDGATIALKVLPPSLTLSERALARFLREGRLMARVEHPDIVRWLGQGSGSASGVRLFWFAMEFVDGASMQERLRVGPLPMRAAVTIAARVARALHFAHERGVVHRDLKPGNLLLRSPEPLAGEDAPPVAISDFGLARETGTGSMTDSGALVGTPMYVAPELILSGSANANSISDVYSLGATLYTLLTGEPPFDGPTAQIVLKAVLEREPRRMRSLRSDLPKPVEAIVQKAMSKEPRHRYGSALEFALDLERWLRGERVLANLQSPLVIAMRNARRKPSIAIAAGCVAALGLCGAYFVHAQHEARIEQGVAEAENWLAQATSARDERDRPRPEPQRRELLLAAISAASDVLARDPQVPAAHFVRAKSHYRLRQLDETVLDLDAAERLMGKPTPEMLHFRIDALRQRGDPASTRRLQQDLTTLLSIDPGDKSRGMVAEHLLEIGLQTSNLEREAALSAADDVLALVSPENPRGAVLRARLFEARGLIDEAIEAIGAARDQFRGDVYVHLQAAALYDRLGMQQEGAQEQQTARMLQPAATSTSTAPVDMQGIGRFLGDVNRLLNQLDPPQKSKQ